MKVQTFNWKLKEKSLGLLKKFCSEVIIDSKKFYVSENFIEFEE